MNKEFYDKIKRSLIGQFNYRNYYDHVFIGHYIARKIELSEIIISKYDEDIATELLNDLIEVRCLPEFEITRNIDTFGQSLRTAIRGLWSGNLELVDFLDAMESTLRRNLMIAWNEGANQCGIKPDELSEDEINAREEFINNQLTYTLDFGTAIQEGSRENGGALEPFLTRAEMWINRYNEIRTIGAAMACADEKRVWTLGPTEKHCKSCGGFNGRVYRFSTWLNNNALPQNNNLCCNGFNCQCNLDPTEQRVTPGKFPRSLLCG